jgi:hypothetical protein
MLRVGALGSAMKRKHVDPGSGKLMRVL